MLTQGGIPPWLATANDPKFNAFLDETRTHLTSGSFDRVLEVCLDQAMEVLFQGVEKNVFGSHNEQGDPMMGQEPRERLAAMLPGLARWCHLALEGLPNELVDVRTPFIPCLLMLTEVCCTCLLPLRPWQTSGRSRRSQQLFIPAMKIAFGNASTVIFVPLYG